MKSSHFCILILLVFCTFLFSCGGKKKNAPKEEIEELVPEEEPEEQLEKTKMLHKIEILQNFSEDLHKDRFYIAMEGDSVMNAKINFEIYNFQNELIFSESFPAKELIDERLLSQNPNPSSVEKMNYVKRRMNEFFDKRNFQTPAISNTDEFDAKNSEKAFWEEIRYNNKSISFTYKVKGEEIRKIAYSQANKKAVLFFKCC